VLPCPMQSPLDLTLLYICSLPPWRRGLQLLSWHQCFPAPHIFSTPPGERCVIPYALFFRISLTGSSTCSHRCTSVDLT
ncbi:hypothetical protein NDU88_000325, partial [Pleurodeles waltl]